VGGQNEVCLAREQQALLVCHAAFFQKLKFAPEHHGVEHHAIADEVEEFWPEDARRHCVEHEFFAVEFERMAGIGAALEPRDDVVLFGQVIHNLTFAFVAPLKAENNVYLHDFIW
jgi:hypothetical protein